MKSYTVLGVNPGLATNTGLAIVSLEKHTYTLHQTQLITFPPKWSEGYRVLDIFEAVFSILNTKGLDIDAVAIERVYHHKNVSSSIKTAKAIGAVLSAVADYDLPVIKLTPRQVKKASGLSSKEDNDNLIRAASRIFGKDIATHHEADAALCAIAGILRALKA